MKYVEKLKVKTKYKIDGDINNNVLQLISHNKYYYQFSYNKKLYDRIRKVSNLNKVDDNIAKYIDIIKFLIENTVFLDNSYGVYIAVYITKNLYYVYYIGVNLNKTIDYSEYLADKLDIYYNGKH